MRPSWIEVDLGAIRHNAAVLATQVAPAELCAVVKADAYGHGDVPAADAALAGGATWLAVALVEEGVRLREAGIEAPILLLSEPDPGDAAEVVRWNLIPTAYRLGFVKALAAAAEERVPVHLKVDTGMHRVGCPPAEAAALAAAIDAEPKLAFDGLWTHLSVAEEDAEFTKRQVGALAAGVAALAERGLRPRFVHAANTAGGLLYPEARGDLVRAGLGIYGLRPAPHVGENLDLRPAMRVVSHVSMVRRLPAGARPSYGRRRALPAAATVATVPVGYADGIPRRLVDGGGQVLIGGKRRVFAGNVTMDQVMVEVGDDPVAVGDQVVLLGRQGEEEIPAEEWARRLGTINYEVVCTFGPRLPRRYSS